MHRIFDKEKKIFFNKANPCLNFCTKRCVFIDRLMFVYILSQMLYICILCLSQYTCSIRNINAFIHMWFYYIENWNNPGFWVSFGRVGVFWLYWFLIFVFQFVFFVCVFCCFLTFSFLFAVVWGFFFCCFLCFLLVFNFFSFLGFFIIFFVSCILGVSLFVLLGFVWLVFFPPKNILCSIKIIYFRRALSITCSCPHVQ